MRQLTIHIPDGKFQFILDMLGKFSFVKIDAPAGDTFVISDEQRLAVNEEIRKIKGDPDYALNWEDAKQTLRFD
jgi:hypothetical protein